MPDVTYEIVEHDGGCGARRCLMNFADIDLPEFLVRRADAAERQVR